MSQTQSKSKSSRSFWTVSQIAQRHQSSEKKVRREIERGHLAAHCFGRQIRVSSKDLLAYERLRRSS